MSQALKTRLNNLAAEVSTLRSDKQAALTVSGTDATGSYRIIDSDQKVRFLKVQPPLTLSLDPTDNSLTIGGTSQIRTFNGNMTFYATHGLPGKPSPWATPTSCSNSPPCPCPAAHLGLLLPPGEHQELPPSRPRS
jgi:hypothetical protein